MFKSLLVPLDGSAFSERSLPLATAVARGASAALHLVQVQEALVPGDLATSRRLEFHGLDLAAYRAHHREEALAHLRGLADRIGEEGVTAHAAVVEGRPVDAIAEQAESVGADAIVMTTHGRSGASRMWLGSVADGLVRRTRVPIILVRAEEDDDAPPEAAAPIRRILVALDGSELAEAALEPAASLAEATGARLILGHVLTGERLLGGDLLPLVPGEATRLREAAESYLATVAERVRAEGHAVEIKLMEGGTAGTMIPTMATYADADLIALATQGHGGLRRVVLGSVADKILRSSRIPLLVLRPGDE